MGVKDAPQSTSTGEQERSPSDAAVGPGGRAQDISDPEPNVIYPVSDLTEWPATPSESSAEDEEYTPPPPSPTDAEDRRRRCVLCRHGSSRRVLMRACHCMKYVHQVCQEEMHPLFDPCHQCGEDLRLRPSHRYTVPTAIWAWIVNHLLQILASIVAILVLLLMVVWCEMYIKQSTRKYKEARQLLASEQDWDHLVPEPILVTWHYIGAVVLLNASVLTIGAIVAINIRFFNQWWESVA